MHNMLEPQFHSHFQRKSLSNVLNIHMSYEFNAIAIECLAKYSYVYHSFLYYTLFDRMFFEHIKQANERQNKQTNE